MRIPSNSNFSREISKQFKQIFHKNMTLGGIENLQEEVKSINLADVGKNYGHKKHVQSSREIGQDKTERESSSERIVQEQRTAKIIVFQASQLEI